MRRRTATIRRSLQENGGLTGARQPDLLGPEATTASVAAKCGLVVLGFALLCNMAEAMWPATALGAVCMFTYLGSLWIDSIACDFIRRRVARLAVPAAFLALVLLNLSGAVGTLTGVRASSAAPITTALLALPFYLLSAAALLTEVALRRMRPPAPLDFLVYMALPFKLLAGPLEPPQLLRQISVLRVTRSRHRLMVAWPWIALGAFMKYVVANRLDPARNLTLTDPVSSFITAGVFELKFYFDFAGYSFMAFGGAALVGLRINQNFNHPFLAGNVVVFWRRWHMSLGRFLTRYVLEPNLALWHNRGQKMVFASSIFLVSAMWHGGTLNYLLWGMFHGTCYYLYGQHLKRRQLPSWMGTAAMLLFFVFGRMLAIDADAQRLLHRLAGFFDPARYIWPSSTDFAALLLPGERNSLLVALAFIALEWWSQKSWARPVGYHLFRRPAVGLFLLILFILFGMPSGALLYARI